jgi:beta-mannosidase
VIDATGRPKAAYWYLKRAWAARGVHITDEGLDGLAIHVVNDAPEPLAATIELEMLRADGVSLESASQAVLVAARGTVTLGAEAMVGHFCDSAAAYRFGPPRHDVVIVRLRDGSGRTLAEDFHFPEGMALPMRHDAKVRAEARWDGEGRVVATIESDTFLQAVSVACDGFAPDDNHFHLAPGREKRIAFRALGRDGARFKVHFEALNLAAPVTVRAVPGAQEQAG